MRQLRYFLVVAEDPDRLFFVSSTLHRKFPSSVIETCRESEAAIAVTRAHSVDAIVALRCADTDELPLVEALRAATTAPIILMSNQHIAAKAVEAGASCFLHYDEWLLIGAKVGQLIGAKPEETAG